MSKRHAKIIKCLIVDDEPMARDVIRWYIERIPWLEVSGEFGNGIDAMLFLQESTVDIIFLDINMPQLTGTDFVRGLRFAPKIIFTTAHKEYAHEGFELDVVDYLLKPIRFDRFLRAINKAFPQHLPDFQSELNMGKLENQFSMPFIYVSVDRRMVKVLLEEVLYIESDKDYVKIVTPAATITTRQTISSIEAMLGKSKFFRIHRSFIVSLDKISSFSNDLVVLGEVELPIGKLYRNSFLDVQGR